LGESIGAWLLYSDEILLNLERMPTNENVIYAFAVQGAIQYIGKTTQALGGTQCYSIIAYRST